MLDVLRKPAAAEQICFRDGAPRLRERGYLSLPNVPGISSPCVPLAAVSAFFKDALIQHAHYGAQGICVLCSAVPHAELPMDVCRASWLIGVQVLMSSKKIAASLDELIAARFDKTPGVRLTHGTHDRLYVFALDRSPRLSGIHLPFEPSRSTRLYQVQKNRGTDEYERVKLFGAGDWFAYSGRCGARSTSGSDPDGPAFYWRSDADLMSIASDDLPTLTAESAAQLRVDVEAVFESQNAERVL
jgi:hypothetical protein